jgi:erythronate-4-phosphate dehydrogenase
LPLDELFDCDFITLHTPLTFEGVDKTYHLAGEKFFKSLKEMCVFVNASRGGVVDSEALKTAIRSGQLRAVVLDVWENEPNIDMELLEMVDIGTPHIAGYSLDGKITGMIMIYKAVCEYFGLEAEFEIEDFLPEPAVRQLRIETSTNNEQDALADAVQKIYNIREDDARLRRVCEKAVEKRGEFFDSLRKNYPIRREFQNTRIVLESSFKSIADKLAGIGFRVEKK